MVRQVLEVTVGRLLERDAADAGEPDHLEMALVNERVTTICRGNAEHEMRDVA